MVYRINYTLFGYNDPVTLRINLSIEALGSLQLSKLNTNGDLVNGCVYNVEGPSYSGDVTVSGGKITLEKLKSGTYLIYEKSVKDGYLIDTKTYRVNVEPGQTATQAIVNEEPVGELTLVKTDIDTGNKDRIDNSSHHGDATLKGTSCGFYAETDIYNVERTVKYFNANEKIANFIFDEYGNANINIVNNSTPAEIYVRGNKLCGLPMGNYVVKEESVSEGYTNNDKIYKIAFEYKDCHTPVISITETITNKVQKAPFQVIKVTTNDNTTAETVADAEFTAILTKYVNFYGSFDEALKHIDEYADDEYAVFRTGSNGRRYFKTFGLWLVHLQ